MSAGCFVAIGDSFSAGSDPGVAAFPDLVAGRLAGWRYENLAVEGARSESVCADQLEPAVALRPDLVSVVCGANDVVRTTRPSLEEFAENLNRILSRLRRSTPRAWLVAATYPAVGRFLPLRERTRGRIFEGLAGVNAEIRRACRHHGVACLELAGHPGAADRSNYASDGFHPSAAGHRNAADAFAECLREQLGIELEPECEEVAL